MIARFLHDHNLHPKPVGTVTVPLPQAHRHRRRAAGSDPAILRVWLSGYILQQ